MNKLTTMIRNKKIIVPTIFAIILLALGLFWLANNKSVPVEGNIGDYRIDAGKVQNSKAGVSFNIPDGWTAEKLDAGQGSVMIYSPDTNAKKTENGTIELPLDQGCLIDAGVIYKDYNLDDLRVEALYMGDSIGASTSSLESLSIGNSEALKYSFDNQKTGRTSIVYMPKNGKVASFALYLPANSDQNKCLEDFGNFLGTVSIK